MNVEVRSEAGARPWVSPRVLRDRARRMLRMLDLSDAVLSILLCDDRAIHQLNRSFRKKDKPTDVLAFAARETPSYVAPGWLGDIVISLDTTERQARDRGRAPLAEATMLLAHGLLHLTGHDHRDRTEERRMTARTDILCAAALRSR